MSNLPTIIDAEFTVISEGEHCFVQEAPEYPKLLMEQKLHIGSVMLVDFGPDQYARYLVTCGSNRVWRETLNDALELVGNYVNDDQYEENYRVTF